jgi:LacI family transcriptional regulator
MLLTDEEESLESRLENVFAEKPDAFFALDEPTSTSVMKMALKKGYKIPEELSVIGFADGIWSRRLTPSLSTISQHGPEIGEAAAKMLIDRLESKENLKPTTQIIRTELRKRDSVKK